MQVPYQTDHNYRYHQRISLVQSNCQFQYLSSNNYLNVAHIEKQQQQRSLSNQSRDSIESRSTIASVSQGTRKQISLQSTPKIPSKIQQTVRTPQMNEMVNQNKYISPNSMACGFNTESSSSQRLSSGQENSNCNGRTRINRRPPPIPNRIDNTLSQSMTRNIHHPSFRLTPPPCNHQLRNGYIQSPCCSTSSSSTTPEAMRHLQQNPPPPPPSTSRPHCVVVNNHLNIEESPSTFSPSTLKTPAHPHHLNHGVNISSGTFPRSGSILRISSRSQLTESQARTCRQECYSNEGIVEQCLIRPGTNSVRNPEISRTSSSSFYVNENQIGQTKQHQSETSVIGVIPLITPVKTGKKVQYRKTKVCPWNQHGRCVMGDNCNYAHAKMELRGRPDLTRTRLCPDAASCKKTNCRFAHDVSQLRATGAFFRTKLCKYWMRGHCPSGDYCRHAHGDHQLRHPEAIVGTEQNCESPRETIELSELCKSEGIPQLTKNWDDQKNRHETDLPLLSPYSNKSVKHDITQQQGEFIFNQESTSNFISQLSDDEITAAVSNYFFLTDENGNKSTDIHSLLDSCNSSDPTNSGIHQLIRALTSAVGNSRNNVETSVQIPNGSSQQSTQDNIETIVNNEITESFIGDTSIHPSSLMFPSADISASDLKLNDILNIAVASEDPDLLECSAKLLRASIQYRKNHPPPQHSLSTSSTAVSSFPSSPRFGNYTPKNLYNQYGQNNQSFYL